MKKTILILASIVTGLAVIYIGFSIFFQSHFCFGTTIDGISVGGKNESQVEEMIADEIAHYSLTLIEREDKTEVITGEEIGIQSVFNGEVASLLEKQQGFYWGMYLFKGQELELQRSATYDEAALDKVIDNLDAVQAKNQREPVNASVSEYGVSGYEIVSADYGTVIDKTALKAQIHEAILSVSHELNLDENNCYVEPEIGNDNKDLLAAIDKLNAYTSMTITYDFEIEKEVLDGSIVSEWLSVDDDLEVVVDREAALAFVKSLGKKYNTAYQSKEFETSYGATITITGGHYGWKISYSEEVEQLLADLEAGKDVEREPMYELRANSHGEKDYGDSYVEINLTAQHLFAYKDGKLVVESDFVSGDVADGNATPTGAFAITYKQKDATLNGENYSTPVNYWMPFNGNVGMHDATWRKNFGGDIYLTNGSHGCINLPKSNAKIIYETIDKGWPVLVYKLPGTQSESSKQKEANIVINAINSIGEVTLDSEAAIVNARQVYESVDSSVKAYVTNYDVLVNAEAVLAQLKAMAAQQTVVPEEQPAAPVEQSVTDVPQQ